VRVADSQLKSAGILAGSAIKAPLHTQALDLYTQMMVDRFGGALSTAGRKVDDYLRIASVSEMRFAAQSEVVGTESGQATVGQVSASIIESLKAQGVAGLTDAGGKEWGLARYAEMVARTTTREVAVAAQMNRLAEYGCDLVIIDTSANPCDLCAEYEQQVFSVSGTHPDYPPLSEAESGGLWHPNCTHTASAYIEKEDA
jgi:hypothetical protein